MAEVISAFADAIIVHRGIWVLIRHADYKIRAEKSRRALRERNMRNMASFSTLRRDQASSAVLQYWKRKGTENFSYGQYVSCSIRVLQVHIWYSKPVDQIWNKIVCTFVNLTARFWYPTHWSRARTHVTCRGYMSRYLQEEKTTNSEKIKAGTITHTDHFGSNIVLLSSKYRV